MSKATKLYQAKLFDLDKGVKSKFEYLGTKVHLLDYSDLRWMNHIENFYLEKRYLTERQFIVLNSIVGRIQSLH